MSCVLPWPSRPGEFHPEPLTDPDVTLSRHPARAIARRLPPSAEPSGSSRYDPVANALPGTKRVAVRWSRVWRDNAPLFENIARSASTRGIDIVSRELGGAEDLAAAFEDAARAGAQCVIFITDNTMFGRRKEIAELALAHRLPSIHSFATEVE